jgi:hypothetical protein
MPRTRFGLRGLCAVVFGVIAIGASAAESEAGGEWLVLDALSLALDAELENSKATLLTKILGALTHISCTAATLIGVKLEGEGSLTNGGKVLFTGCSVAINGKSAPECEVKSTGKAVGTVETLELKGLIVLHKLASGTLDELVRIEPKAGTTFVNLQMGEECPIGEDVPVAGKLFLKDAGNAFLSHQVTHLIEEGPLTQLTALKNPATIDGSLNVFLTGVHAGLLWGGDPA